MILIYALIFPSFSPNFKTTAHLTNTQTTKISQIRLYDHCSYDKVYCISLILFIASKPSMIGKLGYNTDLGMKF